MSPIEACLADLRAALGDRLPPSVHTARLREARGHLLSSAEDVGEAEAVRRYGRPRAVANGLVRSHRGYGERSAWRLAMSLSAAFMALLIVFSPYFWVGAPKGMVALSLFILAGRTALLLVLIAFVARVFQTRRWLFLPISTTHAAGVAQLMIANHLWLAPHSWGWGDVLALAFYFAAFTLGWALVNALAIGAGSLLDRRQVRRSGGAQ